MSNLLQRLERQTLLLDGAMGTELERRGVDTSGKGWTSGAIVHHPDLVTTIHREYIDAGANIITANTFRTNYRAHRSAKHTAEDLTKQAIALARNAVQTSGKLDVLVAGSIAPANDSLDRQQVEIDERALLAEHGQLAKWIDEGGADLILIETMNTVREAFIALAAARRASQLPIALSLVPSSSKQLMSGASLSDSLELLAKSGADVLLLNCQSLTIVSELLREFGTICAGLGVKWGVYPNASEYVDGTWQQVAHEDHEFASFARIAMDSDAAIIGSCCGSTPLTTEAMATVIDAMQS